MSEIKNLYSKGKGGIIVNPNTEADPLQKILHINKSDIKDDFILISIHASGEIKSNVFGRIQNYEYGKDNNWNTLKTNNDIFKPLKYLENQISKSKK